MPDPTAIFDALDTEYQRREAEAGAFPADLAEIAKTTPYVAEKLARQRGWTPTKAVDPEAFAYETAERLLKEAPDTPDEDVLAIKAWAQRRKGVNVVREETAASADQDMTGAAGSAFNATAVPLASEASRATFGIPEFVARKVVAPVVEAVTGAKPATKEQVQAAQAQGREAHPFLSDLSGGVGATAGAMTLMVPAAGAMTPLLAKVGMSPGVASTVANLLAGAAHGGAVEGSAEGALRSGLFMGGQSALGRVFRGATPGAGRYLASEAAAGSTASVLSQLATEGHADPARVLADGVVNALFGIGGARAAGRAKARDHVAAEVAKGREIPEIVADDVFKAMWEESRTYPDPTVEAASTRGEFDARLAEMQASKAEIPAFDPVAEAKATAAQFDAEVAPEPPAPTKPVLEAPRPVTEAPAGGGLGVDVGPTDRGPSKSFNAWRAVFQETLSKTGDVRASFEAAERQHPGDYRPAMTDAAARAMLAEKNAKTDSMVIGLAEMARRTGNDKDAAYWEGQREVYREKNRLDVEGEIAWQETSANVARDLRGLEATHGYLTTEIGKEKVRIKDAAAQARLERPALSGGTTAESPRVGLPAGGPTPAATKAPDAPSSRTLVGKDKRGKEVWEIRGRFYVKDPRGRYGAAHPQEVAEAKASAQPTAIEPRVETPTAAPASETAAPVDPASKYAATPGYQERSVYDPKPSRPAKPTPEAKAIAKAIGESPDSVQWLLNKEAAGTSMYPDEARVYHKVVQHRMDNPPASKPGKQGERGAVNLAPVGEFLGEVAGGVQKVFGETISRVRSLKTPAAEETARKATEAVDAAKAFRGEMGRELLVAEKMTGQTPVTALGKASTELSRPSPVSGERFTEPTLYDAIEGRRPPASPEEARIIDSIRKVIDKTGQLTEREGLMQQDAQGAYAPFVNRTDKIAPRMTTPDFHEIVQRGPSSSAWRPMIDAFIKINPSVSPQKIEAHFDAMHADMAGEGPQSTGAKAQAEFTRGFPRVPATVEVGGRTFRLFETNPATYVRRLVETRAQRLGFVKAFGQDTDQGTPVKELRERFSRETGKPDEFVNLTRELHGHAKDAPIIDPASISGGLLRNVDRAWGVVRESLLSASAIVNIPEPLGATQHLVGTRRLAKAIYVAFRGKAHPMNAAVDALGATTRDAVNASYDPANPRGSVSRMMTEVMSRATGRKFVEEFQERVAAVGGKMLANDLQAGKGSGYDIQSLKTMGWSDADARRLAKGGGTQAEYDAISRKLPTVAVGANQAKAEKSWFQNTRVLRPLNAIASYAHTTIRNAASAHKAFVDTMGRVMDGTGLTPKQRWAGTFRAFQHLTGFYAAKTLQGAAASMLGALVGRSLGIKKSEAEDDPFDFAAKSFVSSTFGGPYATTARAMFGDGNLSQISPQVSVALEAIDAFKGNGKYRDLPLSERMAQLSERFLPAHRVLRSMAVVIGLGNEQAQDIENARDGYWRWRRSFDKTEFTSKSLDEYDAKGNRKTDEQMDAEQSYRTALRSAYLDMTRGADPEAVSRRVLAAIGGADAIGKDRKKAATSIRRRMLLTAPAVKDRLDALKKRIGDRAFKDLEAHDALLDSLADAVQRGE